MRTPNFHKRKADFPGSQRACFLAPMWPKRIMDNVELIENGTRAQRRMDRRHPLEDIRKTLLSKISYYYFKVFRIFCLKGFQYCFRPLTSRLFALVPSVNRSIYYCYCASVSPLLIGYVCGGAGGQITYLLINRLSENKEL